jgi:hypothetical protein
MRPNRPPLAEFAALVYPPGVIHSNRNDLVEPEPSACVPLFFGDRGGETHETGRQR